MKPDLLLKDPVFQLNLLLWMAKEQDASSYRVYPLFHLLGFRIIYIENPFAFPEEAVRAIHDSALDVSIDPEPDMILGREKDGRALYLEAKANSFSANSTNCKQARAHLLASGPVFGEVFSPLKTCLLCYVVPQNGCALMSECLAALVEQLNNSKLGPGSFSCHGLAMKKGQVIYSWDPTFKAHVTENRDEIAVLDDVTKDTDPSPLILVFTDEDCSDLSKRDFYRQVMISQVRANLLCDLHAHNVGSPYEIAVDALLMNTTDQIFQFLGRERQKNLRRLIRENVFKRIYEYWKDRQSGVRLMYDRLTISWSVIGEKEDFLDWLEDRRTSFDVSKPPEELPTLFDQTDSNPKA